MLSPDDTRLRPRLRAARRHEDHHRAELIHGAGYTEDIPARTNVGDTQIAALAVLNLKTGQTVWADGSFAPP
jgi:hypothetical protein